MKVRVSKYLWGKGREGRRAQNSVHSKTTCCLWSGLRFHLNPLPAHLLFTHGAEVTGFMVGLQTCQTCFHTMDFWRCSFLCLECPSLEIVICLPCSLYSDFSSGTIFWERLLWAIELPYWISFISHHNASYYVVFLLFIIYCDLRILYLQTLDWLSTQ